jgi:hypothetical protein
MMQNGISQYERLLENSEENKLNYIRTFIQNMYQKAYSDIVILSQAIPGYQDIWSKRCSLNIQYLRFITMNYNLSPKDEFIDAMASLKTQILDDLEKSLNQNFLNISNHVSRIYLLAESENLDSISGAVKEYLEAKLLIDYAKKKRLLQEDIKISFTSENESKVEEIDNQWYFSIPEDFIKNTCTAMIDGANVGKELEKLYSAVIKKGNK